MRIVFFGDSITEAGATPGGYMTKLRDLIATKNQSANYEIR